MTKIYTIEPTPDRATRNCLDPWLFAMVDSTRGIRPCCARQPIGSISRDSPLTETLNGPEIRELREQLLTGQLDASCRACPHKSLIDVRALRLRVRAELVRTQHE